MGVVTTLIDGVKVFMNGGLPVIFIGIFGTCVTVAIVRNILGRM